MCGSLKARNFGLDKCSKEKIKTKISRNTNNCFLLLRLEHFSHYFPFCSFISFLNLFIYKLNGKINKKQNKNPRWTIELGESGKRWLTYAKNKLGTAGIKKLKRLDEDWIEKDSIQQLNSREPEYVSSLWFHIISYFLLLFLL